MTRTFGSPVVVTMLRSVVAALCLLSVLSSEENKRSKCRDCQGRSKVDLLVGTDDDDNGNIQLVAPLGLHNIRPELKENLLEQGVRSLEEAG